MATQVTTSSPLSEAQIPELWEKQSTYPPLETPLRFAPEPPAIWSPEGRLLYSPIILLKIRELSSFFYRLGNHVAMVNAIIADQVAVPSKNKRRPGEFIISGTVAVNGELLKGSKDLCEFAFVDLWIKHLGIWKLKIAVMYLNHEEGIWEHIADVESF